MPAWFATELRHELDTQGVSIRELARRVDPDHPEVARVNIHRWLRENGPEPTRVSRVAVARALRLPLDRFVEPEPDVDTDLTRAIRATVNQQIDRALKARVR